MSQPVQDPGALRFEVRIVATGVVRDADGNVIGGEEQLEAVDTVDEAQARALAARYGEQR